MKDQKYLENVDGESMFAQECYLLLEYARYSWYFES